MDSDIAAVCIKAIVEKYDDPSDLVEALEYFFKCVEDNSKILERIEALEKDSHEEDLMTPERWQEMIKEIRKSIDPDYEEDEVDEAERLKKAVEEAMDKASYPGGVIPWTPSPNPLIGHPSPWKTPVAPPPDLFGPSTCGGTDAPIVYGAGAC